MTFHDLSDQQGPYWCAMYALPGSLPSLWKQRLIEVLWYKDQHKNVDLTSALKPKLKTSANCGSQLQIGPCMSISQRTFAFMGVMWAPPISCAIGFWKCVEQNPFSELIYSRWGSCHKMPIICFELQRLNLPVHLLLQVEQTSVRASRWDFSPLDIVFLPPNPVNHLLWFYTTSLA